MSPARPHRPRRTTSPLVSVITVCRNSAGTIGRTIESVLSQSYRPLEYIVIDGASSDGTAEIVRTYRRKLASFVSEPDKGISDAFNKGLARAGGKFIHILNADDWMEPDTIAVAAAALRAHPEYGFVFGDIVEVDPSSGRETTIAGDPHYSEWIERVMGRLNHPTVMARRSLYDRVGGFETRWRLAMDYDWLLRVHNAGERGLYVPGIRVRMTPGGIATRNSVDAFGEVRDISVAHGRPWLRAAGFYAARCMKYGLLRAVGRRS